MPPSSAALEAFVAEVRAHPRPYAIEPTDLLSGRKVLNAPLAEQADTLAAAWTTVRQTMLSDGFDQAMWPLTKLLTALQRRRPPLTADQMATALGDATLIWRGGRGSWMPVVGLLAAAESLLAKERLDVLVAALEGLRDALRGDTGAEPRRLAERIDLALRGGRPLDVAQMGPFGQRVMEDLDRDVAMPAPVRDAWKALLNHGLAAKAARPSARWLKQAGSFLAAIGAEAAAAQIRAWLDLGPCPGQPAATPATDRDSDVIKGLLFASWALAEGALAPVVANMAAACLRKIPNIGAVSARAGNACVNVLAELPGPAAITQLGRLRLLVKYQTARRLVDQALDAAAERAGVTPAEIEEMSLPTYDLDARGVARRMLGDVVAEIRIADDEVTLTWRGEGGRLFKSVPESVKRDHAAALGELRRTVKEIGQVLPAQRLRLEILMNTGRALAVEQWRTRYLEHPLIGDMARRLIWTVTAGAATTSVMVLDGKRVDARGGDAEVPADAQVRLFHPLGAAPDETLAWRRLLEDRGVTQPFKQAHREVYLLTPAERATVNYSNRFAGHILRQHQMAALCRDRGWQYQLQGGFDGANNPHFAIPGTDLAVQLWTETPDAWTEARDDEAMAGSGIYLHVATDQVRFLRAGEPVPLEEIPPLIFSEVMRDVDLFVSVSSIGTDPNWIDRGDQQAYGTYWQSFAFGELSASAATRRAVLESVLPKLKIRDRCSLDDRHLVVRGELATYRIHLGSGNVLIEPGSRYLCIVQEPGRPGERVKLPFKGDGMMAVILSKAFLLAADREIKDPSIVRQIQIQPN